MHFELLVARFNSIIAQCDILEISCNVAILRILT